MTKQITVLVSQPISDKSPGFNDTKPLLSSESKKFDIVIAAQRRI